MIEERASLEGQIESMRRRLSDAKRAGLVINGDARPRRVLGNRSSVWKVKR